MTHSKIFAGDNSVAAVLEGLTDIDGNPVTNAVVTLDTIIDKAGVEVTGLTFPISMPHISEGLYRGDVNFAADFVAGESYVGTISAIAPSGFRGEWFERIFAKTRRA